MTPAEAARIAGEQTNTWSEFGLAGLVILALFTTLATGAWLVAREFSAWRKEHSEERKNWQNTMQQQTDKLAAAVDRLAEAFRDGARKP